MSFNVLEIVKSQFTPDLISKAASFLGEKDSNLSKALSGILPSVIAAVTSKASSGTNEASQVMSLAKESHSNGIFNNLGNLIGGNGDLLNKGAMMLQNIFGSKIAGIANTIAGFAGIKNSSATSLMSMAAPAVINSIGKHATENNISTNGLVEMLSSQKKSVMSAMPEGLSSITSLLGLNNIGDTVSTSTRRNLSAVSDTYEAAERETKKGISWLLPLLGFLAIALLAWWFLLGGQKGCSSAKASDNDTITSTIPDVTTDGTDLTTPTVGLGKMDSLSGDFIYDLGKMITINLPNNGGTLEVGEKSTEARLVSFLNDSNQTIDTIKGNWFEFTNVRFKTGSSEITEESKAQLKNLVAIAKSYPAAQFKFGGYTDNTGDSIKNVILSRKRAEVVASKVREFGAAANSITDFAGYGPQWPIGDNNTAEGKAMNRRVAVNVKAK